MVDYGWFKSVMPKRSWEMNIIGLADKAHGELTFPSRDVVVSVKVRKDLVGKAKFEVYGERDSYL